MKNIKIREKNSNKSECINESNILDQEREISSKRGFLSGITHDLKEPINGIRGAVQLLEEYINDEEIFEYINLLKKSVDNLENIISDILDFSDMESADLKLNFTSFKTTEVIESIVEFFENAAIAKNISLNYYINDKNNQNLLGDQRRIKQIVSNILSMAIKRTRVGGIFLSIDVNYKDSLYVDLKCKIKDTQRDIDEVNQDYDFYSDIGFYVSKKLIELMGGMIEVRKDDYGNTISFFIRLRKDASKNNEEKILLENDDSIDQIKILLADDDVISQRLMKLLFDKKKWNMKGVRNGLEAIEEYQKSDFDIVILDLNMPVMNGLEACNKIRAYQREKNDFKPIIALTGYETEFYKDKAYETGVDYYMIKPVDVKELNNLIVRLVVKYKSLNENKEDPDIKMALSKLGGDKSLLKDMIYVFLNTSFLEDIMNNIKYSLESYIKEDLINNIKKLKESMEFIGAKKTLDICDELEETSRYDFDEGKKTFMLLEEEISRLRSFFMNNSL